MNQEIKKSHLFLI